MTKKKLSKIGVYLLILLLCVFYLLPIVWVAISSFKSGAELFRYPPTLFPQEPTIQNYITAMEEANFALFFKNSFFIAVVSTLLTIVINTMAGYAFSKYRFKGDTFIFLFFICTLMLPLEVLMIPIFQMVQKVGFYNNFLGLIIPPAATPMGVFIIRQYFFSVPNELMEAARIDGASETHIFLRLMLPLAKPVMSVLAIFSFMWRWNDYMWPLVVIRDPELYTVQLALANYSGEYSVDWNSLLAMSVVSMIPVLIIFLVFQKQFIKGMVTAGMKE